MNADCNQGKLYGTFIQRIPPTIGITHIFSILWTVIDVKIKGGKQEILHSTQGMRIVQSWVISGIFCSIFIAFSWLSELETHISNGDIFLSFCISQFTTPFFAAHAGMPFEYTPYLWCFTVVIWVVAAIAPQATWLSHTYIPIDLVIVIVAGFILLMSEACHEMHLRTKFGRYDRLKKMGDETLSSLVASDVASSLTVVNQRLEEVDSSMHFRGVSIWVPVKEPNGSITGYRMEKKHSLMFEASMLCRALRARSVEPNEGSFMDNIELKQQRFAFSRMCMRVFAMMEASRSQALALFSAEDTPETFVTGKKGLIFMILYLLIVEAVDPHPALGPGAVIVRCHRVQGRWCIAVSIARAYINVRAGLMSKYCSDEDDSYYDDEDDSIESYEEGAGNIGDEGRKDADEVGVANNSADRSAGSRLAASLAQRYLQNQIETSTNTMKNSGLVVTEHVLPVEGVIPSFMGTDAHSDLLSVKQTWLFIIDDINSRHLLKDSQIVRNLERISVPFETCKLDLLDSLEKRHNVVLVEELTFLTYRSKFVKLLRKVALNVFILSGHTVRDQRDYAISGDFESEFGIEGRRISSDISLYTLLQLVHDTASTMEPRALIQIPGE